MRSRPCCVGMLAPTFFRQGLPLGEETTRLSAYRSGGVAVKRPSSPMLMGCYSIHPPVRQGSSNEPR